MGSCAKCGHEIKGTDRACPECGTVTNREASIKNDVILLAEKAIKGDDSVWGEIYEKTHRYVYYLAFKTLRSDDDAQDIAQEVYIQAMRSIGALQNAESFYAWLRSIIFSKCKDLVKKKKPALLEDDEDGGSPLDDMPELNEEFLPEHVLDSSETRRMVLELVDELPHLQRQSVMFFYYDEMTVDQIASLMECASGTVKSRLNYARQSIKKGVEEYERKGIRLYGMGALPILTILLREEARTLLIPEAFAAGLSALIGTAATGTAGSAAVSGTAGVAVEAAATAGSASSAAAGSLATGAAGTAITTKIIAGVVTVTVVLGGSILLLTNNDRGIDAESTQPPPISTPAESGAAPDSGAQGAAPAENSTGDAVPEAEEEPSYFDTLSDEQKQMLSSLATALMASDYQMAYNIQSTYEFQALCYSIPGWGGFWYYPDDETSIVVYRGHHETTSYEMAIFSGRNGNGRYFQSRYGGIQMDEYGLAIADYIGGTANGMFVIHAFDHWRDVYGYSKLSGTLHDGAAYGPVTSEKDGFVVESDIYPAEALSWWPPWPEGR